MNPLLFGLANALGGYMNSRNATYAREQEEKRYQDQLARDEAARQEQQQYRDIQETKDTRDMLMRRDIGGAENFFAQAQQARDSMDEPTALALGEKGNELLRRWQYPERDLSYLKVTPKHALENAAVYAKMGIPAGTAERAMGPAGAALFADKFRPQAPAQQPAPAMTEAEVPSQPPPPSPPGVQDWINPQAPAGTNPFRSPAEVFSMTPLPSPEMYRKPDLNLIRQNTQVSPFEEAYGRLPGPVDRTELVRTLVSGSSAGLDKEGLGAIADLLDPTNPVTRDKAGALENPYVQDLKSSQAQRNLASADYQNAKTEMLPREMLVKEKDAETRASSAKSAAEKREADVELARRRIINSEYLAQIAARRVDIYGRSVDERQAATAERLAAMERDAALDALKGATSAYSWGLDNLGKTLESYGRGMLPDGTTAPTQQTANPSAPRAGEAEAQKEIHKRLSIVNKTTGEPDISASTINALKRQGWTYSQILAWINSNPRSR